MAEISSDRMGWIRHAATGARWVFGPAALIFLLVAGLGAREAFENVIRNAQTTALLAAVALWSILHLLSPVFTWIVLHGFGARVRYREALAIHVRRLPARYLPGGIWHTVSRVVDLHHHGVGRSELSAMVVLENILPVSVALILAGGFLLAAGHGWRLSGLCMAAGVALLAIAPWVLRHRALSAGRRLGTPRYLSAVAVIAVFWLIAATAFARYWTAFPAETTADLTEIYATYLLAWVSGFVSIFAPQGLGVFESVAGVLLRGALPFAGTALLVAGFRAAILAADVIAYAVFNALGLALAFWRRGPH